MLRPSLCLVVVLAACGGKKSSAPPPPQPATGAPLAFVVDKVTPGDKGSLAVRAYNFSDKRIGQYGVLLRYYDKAGEVVTVKPGTPFEKSYDSWSFSGKRFLCEPKSWCSFDIDHLEIPAATVKAEVLAESLTALKDDIHFDDNELFQLKEHGWPGSDKEPIKWPDAFKPWGDAAKGKAAWQGAWAGDGFGLGNTAAWEVKDDAISFVDKKGPQQFRLTIDSPCTAGFAGGTNGGWQSVYTIKDGQLITGLGDAGQRDGNKALVCGFGSVWSFDGTTCTRWNDHGRRWTSEAGTCGFKQDGGKEIFFYVASNDGYESKLDIDGNTIWSTQLANDHAKKHPDLAAAKAAQKL